MDDFDYRGYSASLEKVLESVQKDYWIQYVDINRHQVLVARTYLWVSAALIGAYFGIYQNYKEHFLSANIWVLIFLVCAFGFGIIAFGLCLYAIPARKGYRLVPSSGWGDFSIDANQLLKAKKPNLYATFLTSFIHKFDQAHYFCLKTNLKRARLLRLTSWLLILSFCLALLAAGTYALTFNEGQKKEEQSMADSDNKPSAETQDSSAGPSQDVAAESPLVPDPPPPAGTGNDTIYTHSLELKVDKSVSGEGKNSVNKR